MARPHIEPLGDRALIIAFGSTIDPAINRRVIEVAARIRLAAMAGVTDIVPSFAAIGVHYEPASIAVGRGELPYVALLRRLRPLLEEHPDAGVADASPIVEIPVCYGGRYGPDLAEAARLCEMTPDELVALHQQPGEPPLKVYMIGFAPGAPYIGLLDQRLSLPRRSTPRIDVPAGTVAIANRQSVIYPYTGPGGWNLIGRTPLTLFDPTRDPPGLLNPGDRVRFRAIDETELLAWPAHRA
ncbi:5-oxoprolinase subunit PxpB [soil metagenome]